MLETVKYLIGSIGPSGYGSKSTVEQVTESCPDLCSITAIKSNLRTPSSASINRPPTSSIRLPLPSRSTSSPFRRFSSRTLAELGCVDSLLPLHSRVAAARMTSHLSSTSRNSRALSQGTLCRTSPDL